MDILKRELSPIPAPAWAEIDAQARKAVTAHLSARRFVDLSGPHGWEFAALPLGRLEVPQEQKREAVRWGIHSVLRLVEARVSFELNRWELDNVVRGARDIDFSPLDAAAKEIAQFEEKLVYHGWPAADIVGLADAAAKNAVALDKSSPEAVLASLGHAMRRLQDAAVEGPYVLVAGPQFWNQIQSMGTYPLENRITALTGGDVVILPGAEEAYLVSVRGGDLELVVGQDLAVGFEGATEEKVRLFFTESLTFRVINADAVVPLK